MDNYSLPSTLETAQADSAQAVRPRKTVPGALIVWIVFPFLFLEFFGPLAFGIISNSPGTSLGVILFVLPTWFLLHVILIAIASGLVGRSWLSGLFVGVSISMSVIVLNVLGAALGSRDSTFFIVGFSTDESLWSILCVAYLLPWALMMGSFALYLCRFLFGWRLTLGPERVPRESLRLIDFFLLMTSIACALWMTTAPQLIMESAGISLSTLTVSTTSLMLSLYTLLVAVPSLYFAFRIQNYSKAWLLSFATSLISPLVFALISAYFSPSSLLATISPFVVVCLITTSLLVGSRRFGVVLQHYEPKTKGAATATSNDFANIQEMDDFLLVAPKFFHSIHFRWTVVLATIALVSSFSVIAMRNQRHALNRRLESLRIELKDQGIVMETRKKQIVSLAFLADADRSKLATFDDPANIEKVSLSGGSLPSDVVKSLSRFPNLKSLDLSNTELTESQLREIIDADFFPRLRHLSIAGNPESKPLIGSISSRMLSAGGLANGNTQKSLDVSNLGLNDNDLEFSLARYYSLTLAGNNITSQGLSKLLDQRNIYLEKLDLSRNRIDGSSIKSRLNAGELILDGCPLTDSSFAPVLVHLQVSKRLVLKNTELTDIFLRNFNGPSGIHGLELGDGNFTEQGVEDFLANATGLQNLHLTGKQFTGRCFANWKPTLISLSMKGSGLTDENVGLLPQVSQLDLSDTAITDVGLAKITPFAFQLDLSNTRVTANGILDCPVAQGATIRLAPGQFSIEDIQRLKLKYKVDLDAPVEW